MGVHRISQVCASLLILASSAPAWAEAKTCGAAYEEAQVARSESRLRDARDDLASCMRTECPEFVRNDCARWLNEVELALPSVVLVAKRGGTEIEDVRVSLDGAPWQEHIDGKAVVVDPGRHVLRFELAGRPAVEVEVIIHEVEKNRLIEATFPDETSRKAAVNAPPAPAAEAPSRVVPYALLGVGALGLAGFSSFALLGNADKHELERSCSPNCSLARVNALHTKYVIADVSLAVGSVALAVASYLLVTGSSERAKQVRAISSTVGLVVAPGTELGTVNLNF
jgi:hypothetical protein